MHKKPSPSHQETTQALFQPSQHRQNPVRTLLYLYHASLAPNGTFPLALLGLDLLAFFTFPLGRVPFFWYYFWYLLCQGSKQHQQTASHRLVGVSSLERDIRCLCCLWRHSVIVYFSSMFCLTTCSHLWLFSCSVCN